MPFVHVELFEGRTLEQKTAIAKEITESIAKHAGAPKSAINVIFTDFPEGTLFQSGEMREKK
ncbi:2-hydroxymuconate tautomerase [Lactococcus fujiensis]|uniref:4-oxalocrotonate tautomerase n=1 Tax=Lactococcus fujiensis JCM 16395 TaxID=1291764 RepID=A0A2A5RIP8_9LACT|nr:2-hydroxymuconate tautomerase [Lactococcus fujiensis]PCR98959.1 4-oxalocrotonate tautomerase [Lactococcus fujiensis JCM 16395]